MNAAEPNVEHLIVASDVFAGDRFWAALDRLAQRRGHDEHPRMLRGTTESTSWYEFRCVGCDQTIATMDVQRPADGTDRHAVRDQRATG